MQLKQNRARGLQVHTAKMMKLVKCFKWYIDTVLQIVYVLKKLYAGNFSFTCIALFEFQDLQCYIAILTSFDKLHMAP